MTNSSEKFKDIKTNVGKQMKLPILKKKDSVFMGWYTDQEYKNKFTDDVLTESLTLYAKWEKQIKLLLNRKKGQLPIKIFRIKLNES